ncbi:MAG: D-2-hydroxyacid dehydrogenase [Ktedonobacterales bacterium]
MTGDSSELAGPRREITRLASDFPFDAADRARLTAALGEGRLLLARSHDELVEIAGAHPEVDVLTPTLYMADLPPLLPNLRWLALPSAGADHVTGQPWASGLGAPIITTANGVHATPISEHVFSAILIWSRRWPELMRLQTERAWPHSVIEKAMYAGRELEDATLLVIGFGAIGRRIARLGRAFGMRALAVRRTAAADATDPDADAVVAMDQLDALLPEADYIVIATPGTAETRGMISAARLALMKPSAMLINIARGGIVDEAALVAALTSGALGAAALDVTAREPLPTDDPLWSAPNLFISPHLTGLSAQYSRRLTDLLLDNIARYREGRPMRNHVQPARGY